MFQSGIDVLHLQASLALFGPWAAFGNKQPFTTISSVQLR